MRSLIRFVDDNPWGVAVLAFVAAVGIVGHRFSEISLAEYLGIVATAGGFLGVGHSVHRGARHIARNRP
jgi:hypothetical protein